MKSRSLYIFAGLLAMTGMVSTVDAATFRMGGASGGTPLGRELPLSLCDANPVPSRYENSGSVNQVNSLGEQIAANKMITWTCNVGGVPTIWKYSATGSHDGIEKTQVSLSFNCSTASNQDKNQNCQAYLPDAPSNNCQAVGVNPQPRPTDNKLFNLFSCDDNPVFETQMLGFSDVKGTSFGQRGPFDNIQPPLPTTGLTNEGSFAVPFDIVVGNNVGELDSNGTIVKLENLSRTEVEAIFARNVTDWRQIGAVTGTLGTNTADATSPITLCLREAGSGTKAAFDATIMLLQSEIPFGSTDLTNPADGVYFGESNQDVRDCIIGNGGTRPAHNKAAGYMEGVQAQGVEDSDLGYVVRVNGSRARDVNAGPTENDKQRTLRCGRHLYWVNENMNVRQEPSGLSAAQLGLQAAWIAAAQSGAQLNNLFPAGLFWDAPDEMYVFKIDDQGPISWKAGPHPACDDNNSGLVN